MSLPEGWKNTMMGIVCASCYTDDMEEMKDVSTLKIGSMRNL
jgi:hypothetical protein